MKDTQQQPVVTAMMRFESILFTRIVPQHILDGMNAKDELSFFKSPVVALKVEFAQSGEAIGVSFRANGCTLGYYTAPAMGASGFQMGPFMYFPAETVAYFSQAADEALAIVAPIIATH